MKATVEDQQALLSVQALDTRLRQLVHRARTLPEISDLATLGQAISAAREELVAAQTEVSDLTRQQAKAEADVQLVRDRAARDRQRLESGTGSAKDLVGLQHELQTLAKRQSDLEDIELDLMERLEAAQTGVGAVEQRLAELLRDQASLADRRDTQLSQIKAEHGQVGRDRAAAVVGLPDGLLALYARVAEHSGGQGAAGLVEGRCGGCRLQLNPAELGRIRSAPADEVVQCEECGCILVRE